MFWKKDKLNSSSLATRLIVLYSLSTIGIILSVALFLYPTINHLIQQSAASASLTAECFRNAIIALLMSSLGSVLFGYLITKKSLKKIEVFSKKMKAITAESLHERINPNQWPKELKALGYDFNIMLDRLEKAFSQLSQFSSEISHELRTPLHYLMTSTEITLAKEQSVQDYQQFLESQLEEYQHLRKLIDHLLFLAKADHGQLQLDKIIFSTKDEIEKIRDYFQVMADEKNIHLTIQGNESIFADKILFQRMIINLISNALKYTKENGSILIATTRHSVSEVMISISDSGIGMDEKHLPHVFDRFYRADPSRSPQSGLGLGLAIVKSIVDLHEGVVSLSSKLNSGTIVSLRLPSLS